MTKLSELNQKAAKLGFVICGSHERKNNYFLLAVEGEENYRTPDTTIEIIEDWLDEISRVGTDEFIATLRREVAALEEMRTKSATGETTDGEE